MSGPFQLGASVLGGGGGSDLLSGGASLLGDGLEAGLDAIDPVAGLAGMLGSPGGNATLIPTNTSTQENTNSSYAPQTITNNSWNPGSTFQPQGFNPGYNSPTYNTPTMNMVGTAGYQPQSLAASGGSPLDGFASMAQTLTGGSAQPLGSPFFNQTGGAPHGASATAMMPSQVSAPIPPNNLSDLLSRSGTTAPSLPQQAPSLGSPQAWGIPQNPPSANVLAQYPNATAAARGSGAGYKAPQKMVPPPPPNTPTIASGMPQGLSPEEAQVIAKMRAQKANPLQQQQAQFDERANAQGYDGSPESAANQLLPNMTPSEQPKDVLHGITSTDLKQANLRRMQLKNRYLEGATEKRQAVTDAKFHLDQAEANFDHFKEQAETYDPETGLTGVLTPQVQAAIARKAAKQYEDDNPRPEMHGLQGPTPRNKGLAIANMLGGGLRPIRMMAAQEDYNRKEENYFRNQQNNVAINDYKKEAEDWRKGLAEAKKQALNAARNNLPIAAKMAHQSVVDARKDHEQAAKNLQIAEKQAEINANHDIMQEMQGQAWREKTKNEAFNRQYKTFMAGLAGENTRLKNVALQISQQRADDYGRSVDNAENRSDLAERKNEYYESTVAPIKAEYMKMNEFRSMGTDPAEDKFKFPRAPYPGALATPAIIRHFQKSTSSNKETREKLEELDWIIPPAK